jgi:hypothetical protein
MKTSDLNNPYRPVPNRIGEIKGGDFVFNEPKSPQKIGYVREIEPWGEFQDSLQELTGEEENEIVIELDLTRFLLWFSFFTLIDLIYTLFTK